MASDILEIVTAGTLESDAAESPRSAVSWAAIIAGAFVAAATSLILVVLGSGLGLAAGSPWSGAGSAVATFTVMTGVWLIVVQWAASGVGGYLTGRLRTRWNDLHTHEVFFRDTAHGFLTWAVATVMVATLAAGAASLAAGAASRNLAASGQAGASGPYAYEVDGLFRSLRPDESVSGPAARAEAARILTKDIAAASPPADDRVYLAALVASRTELSPADAQRRVDDTLSRVRQAADKARRAASATSLFTALAMLIGALIACVAAALGGQQRDEHA